MPERKSIPRKAGKRNPIPLYFLISLLIIVSLLFGGIVFLNVFDQEEWQWNATIDGEWSEDETWEDSYNVHTQYIIPNCSEDHHRDYNYFYIHSTSEWLYVLVDLTSDTTNDPDEDWIGLSLWTRPLNEINCSCYDCGCVAEDQIHQGFEFVYFNKTINRGNQTFDILFTNWDESYQFQETTQLDWEDHEDWNVWVKEGFQKTINSDKKHRIYEFKFRISALEFEKEGTTKGLNERFYIAFEGYGTMSPILSDIWTAPAGNYFGCPVTYYECARTGTDKTRDLNTPYDEADPVCQPPNCTCPDSEPEPL